MGRARCRAWSANPRLPGAEDQDIAPIGFRQPGVVVELVGITCGEQDDRSLYSLTALFLGQGKVQRAETPKHIFRRVSRKVVPHLRLEASRYHGQNLDSLHPGREDVFWRGELKAALQEPKAFQT
jgi:hypothetical protein